MRIAPSLALLLVLPGLPAAAGLYRCVDSGGRIHFVDAPSKCEAAEEFRPSRSIVTSAPAAPAATPARPRPTARSLEELLPGAVEIGPEWEITREVPITQMDRDQKRMGIVSIQARHYGRSHAGVTQVCSIELWRFTSASQASAAVPGAPPHWSFEARGALLVTLRGTRFQRGQPFQKGLFPDCHKLGDLVKAL